ncbi:MAG TPA: ABC transporter permease [Bryobacteraceae bacterium]
MRTLGKNPGYAAISIAALALGIGANTAIFSAVNGVLLNPEGIRDSSRIAALRVHYFKLGLDDIGVSATDYADAAKMTDVFDAVGFSGGLPLNFTGGAMPEQIKTGAVNPRWFDVFGTRPMLGRTFTEEENQPANHHYVVLSYDLWRRLFGSDPNIVGKKAMFDEEPFEILGVMPRGFRMPQQAELWTPIALAVDRYSPQNRYNEQYFGVVRLREGVSFEKASARMTQVTDEIVQREGQGNNKVQWGMFLTPFVDQIAGPLKLALMVLMSAAGLVLLIACANVAGLQLARASGKMKEIALRQALGAGRWQLIRQLLTESLLLSLLGGGLGLLLGYFGMRFLSTAIPSQYSIIETIAVDWRVMLFTAAVAIGSGVLFGIAPALRSSSVQHYESLKEGGRSGTAGGAKQRFRSALVMIELALALTLLAGTGLFLRSLERVRDINPGINPKGVLTGLTVLAPRKYADDKSRAAFVASVIEKLQNSPQVELAAAAMPLPFTGNNWSASFQIEGRQQAPNEPSPHGGSRFVSPDYFKVMGIPLVRGRYFTDADRAGSMLVAIIDTKLASVYFKDEDPIGRRINRGGGWCTIVGVVAYNRHDQLESESKGAYFTPIAQSSPPVMTFLVKTRGNPALLSKTMMEAVVNTDHAQPLFSIKSMEDLIDESLGTRRTVVALLTCFGVLALVLAGLGLYGVISYAVSQRTQEFGIRMALGAAQSQVLVQVLRQGSVVVFAGIACGIVVALSCGRLIASQLYQVEPYDLVTFFGAVAILAAVAFAASVIPARRATRVDPMVALRYE